MGSEYPILLLVVSNNSDVIGWRKCEPGLIWLISVKFHVGVERHFNIKSLTLRVGLDIEFQIWELHILFFLDFARPEWLIILAINIMLLLQIFQKIDERLVWNKAETHTVVDD